MATISLKPIDRVEILSIMDNSVDVLMSSTPVAQRAPRSLDSLSRPQLRAEHGVSMLVTTYAGGNKDSFLFDTGVTVDGVLHNMDGPGSQSQRTARDRLESWPYGPYARV